MRSKIHVLLIDDDNRSSAVKNIKDNFIKIFKDRHYTCEIENISDHDKILNRLSKKERIDIILTDFNLFDNSKKIKNGIDLLIESRNQGYYKQHIAVYTKEPNLTDITDYVYQKMKNNITNFTNFSLFSANNPQEYQDDLEKIVDIYLSRWRELNALRGIVAKVHAELEEDLKEILKLKASSEEISEIEKSAYYILIDEFKKINDKSTWKVFDKWHKARIFRNHFVHGKELLDKKGYYILEKENEKIYEDDILEKRKEILKDFETFKKLIEEYKTKR